MTGFPFFGRAPRDGFSRMNQRCGALIDEIGTPPDLKSLLASLSAKRERPIIPVPTVLPPEGPSAFLAHMPNEIWIFFSTNTSKLHQNHTILHEIGHLVFEHRGITDAERVLSQAHFPDIDPSIVISMLLRSSYSDEQEAEAELFASVMGMALHEWRPAQDEWIVPDEVAPIVERIQKFLGSPY
ncbi:hypothetical protein [Nocardia sp. NPDC050435]|uniref:ImmA/IrrE family metallo-endopeptidase n=1 Tax=Nocardia sp. NPDC050435 TaxID=3155040 RepID=UPI0034058A3D